MIMIIMQRIELESDDDDRHSQFGANNVTRPTLILIFLQCIYIATI